MTESALVLRDPGDAAIRDFAAGGARRTRREPLVFDHWRRALALGASASGPTPEDHLVRGSELAEHVERVGLVTHVAADELDRAAGAASLNDYVLLLTDPNGLVIRASGGGAFVPRARQARLIAGASWSEANRGTNAIGTAIAESRPVFVLGRAHYARTFHDFVCYAAPIFDADGSLVAVLDATSDVRRSDENVAAMVVRAAAEISRALRDRAFGRAGAAVTRTLARALVRMDGIAFLVEAPSTITQMNAGARRAFGDRPVASVEAALGIRASALVAESRAPSGLVVAVGGRDHRVRAEPIETSDGIVIAMLVFLEPTTQRASRPPPASSAARAKDAHVRGFVRVFSRDLRLDQAIHWAERVADSRVPVLLRAETGSGKELFARAIHASSARRDRPFVPVNCGAIASSLLESELFGYGPGAFTGAERSGRDGLFAAATDGTLFLDEVAEMSLPMQASLLRVLEDGEFRRVGETAPRRADVRVVSATCADLDAMVERGTFRRDLYFRLKGAEVALPPLRSRTDLPQLVDALVRELCVVEGRPNPPRISAEVLEAFGRYSWPGNVRELRSTLEVCLLLAADETAILLAHLPPHFGSMPAGRGADDVRADDTDLAGAERATVRRVLGEVRGNVSRAAERLGVARSTLYRMMRRHRLDE